MTAQAGDASFQGLMETRMSSAGRIRQQMKRQRRAIEPALRRQLNQSLCRHILNSHYYRNAQTLAGYFPVAGEPDLMPVLRQALDHGKQVFLPVVTGPARPLRFRAWAPDMPMIENRFGIPEPPGADWEGFLDLVLTPLLAFDRQGNRIGMGAGFYDRTFAFLRSRHCWRSPTLVGTAWAFQELERVETEPWDVPLNAVVTEKGWRATQDSNSQEP